MKEKITIQNQSFKISSGSWINRLEQNGDEVKGYVLTKNGIVAVDMYDTYLCFCMSWNGTEYYRDINGKRYSGRYIVTLARRFAEEIVEENK